MRLCTSYWIHDPYMLCLTSDLNLLQNFRGNRNSAIQLQWATKLLRLTSDLNLFQIQSAPSLSYARHEATRELPLHLAMHFMKPLVSSSLFKFFPMNTILQRLSSSSFHSPSMEFAKSM